MHTPQQHKFGFKAWIPTIGLAFAAFVFNTSEFLPVGLLPNIAESIHESVSKTGLIITVYAWVVSLLSLPLTILTAKLERRRLLLWLIVIFALSHFVVLWADTFEKLMGARVCVAVTHSIFWSIMTPLAARVAPFGKQAFGLAAVMGGSIVATVLGVPIGFFTAIYLAKLAPPRLKSVLSSAVSLLSGIPSVVYGLVGMLVLVPGIRNLFQIPDGASLLAAIMQTGAAVASMR